MHDLRKISKEIGDNIDLVQGAGGNTSVKEKGVLWIKASGCWLSDAMERDIFVPVDNTKVLNSVDSGGTPSVLSESRVRSADASLRPSIETVLHSLMPHKFVLHVHPVNTLSILVLDNGIKYIDKLLGDLNWAWVPYIKPGSDLAKFVQRVVKIDTDIVFLANHGLVVGAETAQKALDLLLLIENKLSRKVRKSGQICSDRLKLSVNESEYKLPKYEIAHKIANDEIALQVVDNGSLYPDHVVFLGAGPMEIMSIEEFEEGPAKHNFGNSNVAIIRNHGVVVHSNISDNAESMLYCLASILMRLQKGEKLRYLTQKEEMELMNWDAEKYRQLIQR